MRRVLALVTMAALVSPASSQTGAQPCPGLPDVSGYTSVFALNNDMLFELAQIATGTAPQPEYEFILCPNTVFDFTPAPGNETNTTLPVVPLMPVLNNVVFQCGTTGNVDDECIFSGGDTQVEIEDSNVADFPLEMVTFRGLTFSEFDDAAIAGGADDTTTVFILDSNFEVSARE